MTDAAMLASLMRQAEGQGVDLTTLKALVEEASQAGAERALGALGLEGPGARRDMDELRELLQAWRDAKRSAVRAVVGWVVRFGLALLLVGLAFKLGLTDLMRGADPADASRAVGTYGDGSAIDLAPVVVPLLTAN